MGYTEKSSREVRIRCKDEQMGGEAIRRARENIVSEQEGVMLRIVPEKEGLSSLLSITP